MPAATRSTLVKDSCHKKLALFVMLAAGVGLSACNAESVAGPSRSGQPIGEVGAGGGDGEEIGSPGGPCLLLKAIPCR